MAIDQHMSKERENFENTVKNLEKIVEELNQGNLDLDLSLQKFREGVDLIKICRKELETTENEFKKIKADLELTKEEKSE